MDQRNARWRSLAGALSTLALAVVTGCGPAENYPQSSLDPHSDFTTMIHSLFQVEYYLAVAVFVLVEAALPLVAASWAASALTATEMLPLPTRPLNVTV